MPSVQSLSLNSALRAVAIPLLIWLWKLPKPLRTLRTLPVELPLLPLPCNEQSVRVHTVLTSQIAPVRTPRFSITPLHGPDEADICQCLMERYKGRPKYVQVRCINHAAGWDALLNPQAPSGSGGMQRWVDDNDGKRVALHA